MTREDAHTRRTGTEDVCEEPECRRRAFEFRRAWLKKGRLTVDLWLECTDGHRFNSRRYTASSTDDMATRAWPGDPIA